MNFDYNILNESNFNISNWSGGTTTQLYIYPQNSIYQERLFNWRISSATIDLEESDFTPLEGFMRYIRAR